MCARVCVYIYAVANCERMRGIFVHLVLGDWVCISLKDSYIPRSLVHFKHLYNRNMYYYYVLCIQYTGGRFLRPTNRNSKIALKLKKRWTDSRYGVCNELSQFWMLAKWRLCVEWQMDVFGNSIEESHKLTKNWMRSVKLKRF